MVKSFRFNEIAGAPDEPGLYSWYYRVELADKDITDCIAGVKSAASQVDRESVVRAFLEDRLFRCYREVPYSVTLSGKLKPRYQGKIDHAPDMSNSLIARLAQNPETLHDVKQALKLAVPQFASPIYIGVAERLRKRLLQHVSLIGYYLNLQASALDLDPTAGATSEEDASDHKFAYEVSMVRGFRASNLIVNTLQLPVHDTVRYDLENILNRINYPLCGRN